MKTVVDHLSQYASYHRDPRNIATHFVGIPMIVLAVTILLSRPGWDVAGMWLSPALLAAAASVWFYLRLDLRFGLVMGLLLGLCLWVGGTGIADDSAVARSRAGGVRGGLDHPVRRPLLRRPQAGVCR